MRRCIKEKNVLALFHWAWVVTLISRSEGVFLTIFASVLSIQLFISPYIGIADNGDFVKIAGRLSLRPTDPDYQFKYFNDNSSKPARDLEELE